MRLRTFNGTIKDIKEKDPYTSFTLYALRKLVYDGTIPHIKRGNRFLIDLDSVYSYLSSTEIISEPMQEKVCKEDYHRHVKYTSRF